MLKKCKKKNLELISRTNVLNKDIQKKLIFNCEYKDNEISKINNYISSHQIKQYKYK